MNPAHIHLLLNHVPVIGTIITIPLLGWALLRRNAALLRTALAMLVAFSIAGGIVYLTGEPAEEAVEHLAGVSERVLELHEEAALLATVLLGLTGAVALGGLVAFRSRRSGIPQGFAVLVLVLSLLPAGAMAWTANLGGQIRHSEIRGTAVASAGEENTGVERNGASHDTDDEQ
jgi:hypothetical protein